MSTEIIDPNYNWKQAATQEGVDYDAVQKSFMDQSYGVVANKAKILFQDPFRLGFEIVHRNEKATKMVGIFAFRVNKNLLYAPTFFVNGEIKAADMLYRSDVKRFVPLTEDWCAYLVRGAQESSGETVDKNRFRQADAYMDRLAYPQRVKYARERDFSDVEISVEKRGDEFFINGFVLPAAQKEQIKEAVTSLKENASGLSDARDEFVKAAADGSLFRELMLHCADNEPMRKLLPEVINETGPEALEKLATLIDGNDTASRHLASHYTKEELETVDAWLEKEAADDGPQPAIVLNMNPHMAKSASARDRIFDKGYELVDRRPPECVNTVVEEVGEGTIKELSAPGKVCVLMDSGELEEACLFRRDEELLHNPSDPMTTCSEEYPDGQLEYVYFPESKELLCLGYGQDVFGDELIDQNSSASLVDATSLQPGKCYVAVSAEVRGISQVFRMEGTEKDGESTCINICDQYGDDSRIFYAPGRKEAQGRYISDETKFLEVVCDVEDSEDDDHSAWPPGFRFIEPKCSKTIMNSGGVDQWLRTAGGITSSRDLTVRSNNDGLTFDVEHRENGTLLKSARDLGMLEAHLKMAEDFCLTTDKAGEILDKAVDNDVTYRVFDTLSKEAFLTRAEGMEDWIESFDPELQVKLDAPQEQVLTTHTPRRPEQTQRYGDTHQRVPAKNKESGEDMMLPMDAVLTQPPEALAQMSEMYDLPHIFDHGCVGQMATSSHNLVEQIKKYIPDLETGVDRYFRILFLLRYRPSDFEEVYGKDDLVEFEEDLTELASRAGEQLLKVLKQFEPDQYAAQEN